jgi:hypothetical protein
VNDLDEAYDDYYDAAKKDGEPVIQGRHGGTIWTCERCREYSEEPQGRQCPWHWGFRHPDGTAGYWSEK